jgi:release factor glutamine methyltransferase
LTIHDAIITAAARLRRAGIDAQEAALDAELLARHVLGWDRARLLTSWQQEASPEFSAAHDQAVLRRERREPAAYIIGVREFWNLELEVSRDVLVPRPETELIVEEALACVASHLPNRSLARPEARPLRIADVGTGSGCLAIALAAELKDARVVAVDISTRALQVARHNARRHGVDSRIFTVASNVLDGIATTFDAIVSNPPYIPRRDLSSLPPEVSRYEPMTALDGGGDGLDTIRGLLEHSGTRLKPQGWLIFEFGAGQEEGVRRAVEVHRSLTLVRVRKDLQGIPRTAVCNSSSQ